MGRYLDKVKEWERKNSRGPTIDGHQVKEIIWETPKMTIFRDDAGKLWRRVNSWGMTWPVSLERQQ
jgi:hypothetical protein